MDGPKFKKIIFFVFLFSKRVEIFCLILINFFPWYLKKYKFKHTASVFLFGYSSNR